MLNFSHDEFKNDIKKSIKIFQEKLGYNPIFFSYPFGEYNLRQTKFIKGNFKYGFGQHSGVIDLTKNRFELPRFPINEKYGELGRFKSLINYFPLEYKLLEPQEKKIGKNDNPPSLVVEFFNEQQNINNINCYSNDGGNWKKSNLIFKNNKLIIN